MFIWILTLLAILAQFLLPLRLSYIPLIFAALHIGNQELAANLTPCRLVIIAGIVRGLGLGGRHGYSWKWCRADLFIVGFVVVALITALFDRGDIPSPLMQNLGLILNVAGTYLYGRIYMPVLEEVTGFLAAVCILVLPLAIGMLTEVVTGENAYTALGSTREEAAVRGDRVRSAGPFGHPILAGTCGAVLAPLVLALRRRKPRLAAFGLAGTVAIVVSSGSSGPLSALAVGLGLAMAFRLRTNLRNFRYWIICLLALLHLISTRGVWFLMARIDLVGGSTGYHRAKLIDSAIANFWDWWLVGTDNTADWMSRAINPWHVDLTNYYIHLGVIGGIGLVATMVLTLLDVFRRLRERRMSLQTGSLESEPGDLADLIAKEQEDNEYVLWCLGCSLVAHSLSMISVSYFDQMYALFYLKLALGVNVTATTGTESRVQGQGRIVEG